MGRVANRIQNGTFELDGQRYILDKNDHGNTLHGGFNPFFENNTWTVEEASDKEVKLSLFSPTGTQVLILLALCPKSLMSAFFGAADLSAAMISDERLVQCPPTLRSRPRSLHLPCVSICHAAGTASLVVCCSSCLALGTGPLSGYLLVTLGCTALHFYQRSFHYDR